MGKNLQFMEFLVKKSEKILNVRIIFLCFDY